MRAFREVRANGTLPATQVIPSTSNSGESQHGQNGDCVILTGIGVKDDRAWSHGCSLGVKVLVPIPRRFTISA